MASVVPIVPRKRADDLIERIAVLKADASGRGFETLAYFLDMALTEAEIQVRRLNGSNANSAGPDDHS